MKEAWMEASRQILIIDDEPDFIETMRFYLENANFRLLGASTIKEGLEKALLKPDLILLDLNMPDGSGHEVCKKLKENPATVCIPVIMLTSQSGTLDKVEALNLGAADYIGKQFPFEEILARINAVLRAYSAPVVREKPAHLVPAYCQSCFPRSDWLRGAYPRAQRHFL
jgi:DNA-binding response OmpR family regulator